jgi:hypothetical protein
MSCEDFWDVAARGQLDQVILRMEKNLFVACCQLRMLTGDFNRVDIFLLVKVGSR